MSFMRFYRVGLLGYVQHDLVRGEWRGSAFFAPVRRRLNRAVCCRAPRTI